MNEEKGGIILRKLYLREVAQMNVKILDKKITVKIIQRITV